MMKYSDIKTAENEKFFDLFSRLDACMVSGKKAKLYDTTGKEYIDFLSGIAVCCLGYSNKGFKKALKKQVDAIIHTSNYFYIESQSKLLNSLHQATGYDRAFFSNSGAEAVEGAIKLARKYFFDKGENKTQIITFNGSFHGRTLATLAATGQEKFHKPYQPLIESFVHVDYSDIEALKRAISKKTCAVLIEPVLGEGGVFPAGEEFYQAVKKLCVKNDILMIADEIQTGVGRSGKFLASQTYGVKPDIVVLAKSLGNGLPIGAFLATSEVASAFSKGDHGSTYGGNHLACCGAHYVIDTLNNTDIMDKVAKKGAYFLKKLNGLKKHDCIADIRGFGLMLGVQFKPDYIAGDYQKALFEAGFISATAASNTLRFLPPYIIKKKQIDKLVNKLNKIIVKNYKEC
jgi:acetylornithine/N-succinyldiaminopimelate aminotransferase